MNCDIARMTFAVRVKREFLELERELGMAIELKGIRGKAVKAAANLDRLNAAYDAFNEAAPAHAADVESLAPQIAGMQEDLQFAAQVLGNSVAASNAPAEKPAAPPVVVEAEKPAASPEPPQPQQSGIPALRWDEHGERMREGGQ